MVMPNEVPVPINEPLREQRRSLWNRASTFFYGRHSGQGSAVLPPKALAESGAPAAQHLWDTPRAFVLKMFDRERPRPAAIHESSPVPLPAAGSAATEAALVQRITGPGSGPYSGTPFLVVPRTTDLAQPRAADEPCEAARHDRGIIDHSRHVSSIGRR